VKRKIDVRIGEIVVQGSPADAPHDLAGTIEEELSRLVARRGLPGVRSGELERIDTEETPETRSEGTGVRLARAIYGGLRR
jgi:hypothetical protein